MIQLDDNPTPRIHHTATDMRDHDIGLLVMPPARRSLSQVKEDLLQTEVYDGICLGIAKTYLRYRSNSAYAGAETTSLEKRLERYALRESIERVREVKTTISIELTKHGYTQAMLDRDRLQTWSKLKGTLGLTALSMTGMVAARYAGDTLVQALNPGSAMILGNPGGATFLEDIVSSNDPSCVVAFLFFACLGEENLLRKMPLDLISRAVERGSKLVKNYAPAISLGSSALFAVAHNLAIGEVASGIEILPGMSFRTDALPFQQFVLGVGMWQIASRYGTHFALLGHFINNSVSLGLMCLL